MSYSGKERIALLTAYDADPYRGGESAVGWNVAVQASKSINVLLITRVNNNTNIDRYISANGRIENLTVKYFDLPYWFRFWKKGPRGASLYFYLWQMFIPFHIKLNKYDFDLLHSVNFVADSFPNFLWWLKKPVIWGPISQHEKIPQEYVAKYGRMAFLKDRLIWLVKLFFWRLDPFNYLSKWKSAKILVGNRSVCKRLKGNNLKYVLFSSSAVSRLPVIFSKSENQTFSFLIVARLVPLKSVDLAIEAFDVFLKKKS
jgi:glycosyltransferase involved in cell wall biosynthesis